MFSELPDSFKDSSVNLKGFKTLEWKHNLEKIVYYFHRYILLLKELFLDI